MGGRRCPCRLDATRSSAACKFYRIRHAPHDGNNRTINGVEYSAAEIRAERTHQLRAMGFVRTDLLAFENRDLRCCSCHYVAADFFAGARDGELKFDARPTGKKSVQVNLPPTTPAPDSRVRDRTVEALDKAMDSPDSLTASPFKVAKRMVLSTPHLEHDLQQLRAELHEEKLFGAAAKTREASLHLEISQLRQAFETELLKSSILAHQLSARLMASVLSDEAKANGDLPLDFPGLEFQSCISFKRFQRDKLFSTNVLGAFCCFCCIHVNVVVVFMLYRNDWFPVRQERGVVLQFSHGVHGWRYAKGVRPIPIRRQFGSPLCPGRPLRQFG